MDLVISLSSDLYDLSLASEEVPDIDGLSFYIRDKLADVGVDFGYDLFGKWVSGKKNSPGLIDYGIAYQDKSKIFILYSGERGAKSVDHLFMADRGQMAADYFIHQIYSEWCLSNKNQKIKEIRQANDHALGKSAHKGWLKRFFGNTD